MTKEELMSAVCQSATPLPVLLKDGQLGLLLIAGSPKEEVGVQVPGEEYHRWIKPDDLRMEGDGALIQLGAPSFEEVAKRFETR